MKYLASFAVIFLCLSFTSIAQVGMGTSTPSEKSMLEVSSQINGTGNYKGLMPPRVPSEAERDAIATTTEDLGLIVFVISTNCLDMYNGSSWEHIKCSESTSIPVPLTNNQIFKGEGKTVIQAPDVKGNNL